MDKLQLLKIYKDILLKIINVVDIYTVGRKKKYSDEFCLDNILHVLTYCLSWSSLHGVCNSAIKKRFYKWKDMGIFYKSYDLLTTLFSSCNRDFFIDSTIIQNHNNNDLADYTFKIKSKKKLLLNHYSQYKYIQNFTKKLAHITQHIFKMDLSLKSLCLEGVLLMVRDIFDDDVAANFWGGF